MSSVRLIFKVYKKIAQNIMSAYERQYNNNIILRGISPNQTKHFRFIHKYF